MKKTFLDYLVESAIGKPWSDEWRGNKKAQYTIFGFYILFFVLVLGGIIAYNMGI